MVLFVNLSAIHTLHPISVSVAEFAKQRDLYSPPGRGCPNCFSFFTRQLSFLPTASSLWVQYQYYQKYKTLIEPYRLGKITTDEFLDNLNTIFDFKIPQDSSRDESTSENSELSDQENPDYNDTESDFENPFDSDEPVDDTLTAFQDPRVNYSSNPKLALLERAWNATIDLDETTKPRFAQLLAEEKPIYLISNTNELNVLAILALLKNANPTIQFKVPLDLSVKHDASPIEIAPNVFLCLSYRYQLFKTASQNPNTTMSLIRELVNTELKGDVTDVEVISQWAADLEEARNLGVTEDQIHDAKTYFASESLHNSCK